MTPDWSERLLRKDVRCIRRQPLSDFRPHRTCYVNLLDETLVVDTAYGSGEMLGWLVDEQGIDPHIPVFDKTERGDGAFPATAVIFDPEVNEYTCPAAGS